MSPEAFGIQRFTRRIRERLDQILSDGPFGRIDGFSWSDGANRQEVTARRPDGPGDPRDLDEIALIEAGHAHRDENGRVRSA